MEFKMKKLVIFFFFVSAFIIFENEAHYFRRKLPCQKYCYTIGYNNVITFKCCSYTEKPGMCPPQVCEFNSYFQSICSYNAISCYNDMFCPFGYKCCYDYCLRSKICRRVWEPRLNNTPINTPKPGLSSTEITSTVNDFTTINSTDASITTTEGTTISTTTTDSVITTTTEDTTISTTTTDDVIITTTEDTTISTTTTDHVIIITTEEASISATTIDDHIITTTENTIISDATTDDINKTEGLTPVTIPNIPSITASDENLAGSGSGSGSGDNIDESGSGSGSGSGGGKDDQDVPAVKSLHGHMHHDEDLFFI